MPAQWRMRKNLLHLLLDSTLCTQFQKHAATTDEQALRHRVHARERDQKSTPAPQGAKQHATAAAAAAFFLSSSHLFINPVKGALFKKA